ncbi:MAG: hypothetical protein HYY84_03730 [Deltaproteobacteria bacterium]|nr:hypothetical protein [Deltaproteobacteria bacterium]
MRTLPLLLVFAALPTRVFANHVSIGSGTVTGSLSSSASQLAYNSSTCSDSSKTATITFPVTFTSGATVASDAKYAIRAKYSSSASCTIATTDSCYEILAAGTFTTSVTSINSGTVTLAKLANNACSTGGSNTITVEALVEDPNGGLTSAGTTTQHGTTDNPKRGTVTLTLDNEAPGATTMSGVAEGESRLTVSWNASTASDVGGYKVYYTNLGASLTAGAAVPTCGSDPTTGVACSSDLGSSTTSAEISGLTNNTAAYVAVAVIDKAGNKSVLSDIGTGTPQPVDDFFEFYVKQGGGERGGFCFIATAAFGRYDDPQVKVLRRYRDEVLAKSVVGRAFVALYYALSPPVADFIRDSDAARAATRIVLWPAVAYAWFVTNLTLPLAVLLLVFIGFGHRIQLYFRRSGAKASGLSVRRKWGAPACRARTRPSFVAKRRRLVPAVAAVVALVAVGSARADESPRNFMLELRFGPYKPSIDSEKSFSSPPYKTIFGDKTGLMFQLELDYQFFQKFGSLAVGASAGYWQMIGKGVFSASGSPSGDNTLLTVVPLQLSLIYRFDVLSERAKIPVVPYVKGGLTYSVFVVNDGGGDTSTTTDSAGRSHQSFGGVFGLHGAFGLSMQLDWMDPDAARTFDLEVGVNHTYIFVELGYAWVNDFGGGGLNLSALSFYAGLAFEF